MPAEDAAQYEALFDPDTALPRWALLLDRAEVALARATRSNRKVAVFVLDGVRTPSGGRPDLERLADALRRSVRTDDTVARVADQTFVVVCNNIGRERDAALVAQRLLQQSGVTCRVGVALSTAGQGAASLLGVAFDQARGAPSG